MPAIASRVVLYDVFFYSEKEFLKAVNSFEIRLIWDIERKKNCKILQAPLDLIFFHDTSFLTNNDINKAFAIGWKIPLPAFCIIKHIWYAQ